MKNFKGYFGSDIDDTVTDTVAFIRRLIMENFGIDLSGVKFDRYYYSQLSEILTEEVRDKIFNEFRITECGNIRLLPEAAWALKLIRQSGYEVPLVTSRGLDARPRTEEWLKKEKLSCDRLIFSDRKWKLDIPFSFFAEDSALQSLKLAEKGVGVFLIDKEWNRKAEECPDIDSHPNIIRVGGWEEIIKLLRFFGTIEK